MMSIDINQGEPEFYAAEYGGNIHIFDDPGDRHLWMDEVINHGAEPTDVELWEY